MASTSLRSQGSLSLGSLCLTHPSESVLPTTTWLIDFEKDKGLLLLDEDGVCCLGGLDEGFLYLKLDVTWHVLLVMRVCEMHCIAEREVWKECSTIIFCIKTKKNVQLLLNYYY